MLVLVWLDLNRARWYSSSCLVIFCSSEMDEEEEVMFLVDSTGFWWGWPWLRSLELLDPDDIAVAMGWGCSATLPLLASFFLATATIATISWSLEYIAASWVWTFISRDLSARPWTEKRRLFSWATMWPKLFTQIYTQGGQWNKQQWLTVRNRWLVM